MQKITPENAEDESNHTIAAAYTMHTISETNKDNVNFLWVWKHVRKSPWSTRSLLSSEVQVQVTDEYNELENSFEHFQWKLRQVIGEAKRKRDSITDQITLYNMFEKWTLNYLH